MTLYQKTMTPDYPLVIVEVWNSAFQDMLPDLCEFEWPKPLFIFRNGAVESHRATNQFHQQLPLKIAAWLKDPEQRKKFSLSLDIYEEVVQKIKKYEVKQVSTKDAVAAINSLLQLNLDGVTGLIAAYWAGEWNKQAIVEHKPPIIETALAERIDFLRNKDTLVDDIADIIRKYFIIIAQNEHIDAELIKFFLRSELAALASQKAQDITRMKERSVGYIYFDKTLFPLGQLQTFLKEHKIQLSESDEVQHHHDVLHGTISNTGTAKGPAKVIFNREQLPKMQKGDILVAPMTTPWYIPAMEKAAAFVTDEGGMLSHAAIISREMKKPCIVGTKVATKVFKDGDLIDVDADNGVVRNISK